MLNVSTSFGFAQALASAKRASLQQDAGVAQAQGNARLHRRIAEYGFCVNPDTDNTGDCQFDSAADQMNRNAGVKGTRLSKEEVRNTAVEWLKENGQYRLVGGHCSLVVCRRRVVSSLI